MTHEPPNDEGRLRLRAVELALEMDRGARPEDVFRLADRVLRYATGDLPVSLSVVRGLIREQPPSTSNIRYVMKETGPVQITDTQQFDFTVDAEDSKGFSTSDSFSASSSDESVAAVSQGADGKTFTVVAGNPGSAVVTITDGTLSATEAVDVVAGGTATISITEGAVTDQPPAVPAP